MDYVSEFMTWKNASFGAAFTLLGYMTKSLIEVIRLRYGRDQQIDVHRLAEKKQDAAIYQRIAEFEVKLRREAEENRIKSSQNWEKRLNSSHEKIDKLQLAVKQLHELHKKCLRAEIESRERMLALEKKHTNEINELKALIQNERAEMKKKLKAAREKNPLCDCGKYPRAG